MIPNLEFKNQPKMFWAYVRTLSQHLGYTVKGEARVRIPTIPELRAGLTELGLDPTRVAANSNAPTQLGADLCRYFEYRAQILNGFVKSQLMDAIQAKELFERLQKTCKYECPLPKNKQSGEKANAAYFTGIINMLVATGVEGAECNYSPSELTVITRGGAAVRTFSRRLDGAFPRVVNPIAVWEIKEYYYYTTTFGSRIADGVYETLVDGMEIEELREHEGIDVKRYLMVDAYDTGWLKGRSYLCRMIDMLHMYYVDEILFGREVVDRIPLLASQWVEILKKRGA